MTSWVPVALLVVLSACAKAEPAGSQAPPPSPGESKGHGVDHATATPVVPLDAKVFGATITEGATTSLTSIAEDPDEIRR